MPDATEKEFHESGGRLIDSAMRFSAYAPNELTVVSYKLAATIQIGLMAKTTEQKVNAITLAKVALTNWPKEYYGLMDNYAQRRNACLN